MRLKWRSQHEYLSTLQNSCESYPIGAHDQTCSLSLRLLWRTLFIARETQHHRRTDHPCRGCLFRVFVATHWHSAQQRIFPGFVYDCGRRLHVAVYEASSCLVKIVVATIAPVEHIRGFGWEMSRTRRIETSSSSPGSCRSAAHRPGTRASIVRSMDRRRLARHS